MRRIVPTPVVKTPPVLATFSLSSLSRIPIGSLVSFSYLKEGARNNETRIIVVTGETSNLIQGHDLNRDTEFRAFKRSRVTSNITLLGHYTSPGL